MVSQMYLSLSDGSQLFPEDQVGDVICAEEVIKVNITEELPSSQNVHGVVDEPDSRSEKSRKPDVEETCEDKGLSQGAAKRVKIVVVTPQLARNASKGMAGKIMAFGGSSVSVEMPMGEVRREVARTLGWLDDHNGIPEDNHQVTPAEKKIRGSCSCTVANQIATHGRFEQLHCPKEIDGSHCGDETCHYSHAPLGLSAYSDIYMLVKERLSDSVWYAG